jgi:hypothetical protein
LGQFEEAHKRSNKRGFSWRLFPSLFGIRMFPVFIVAVNWKIDIKAEKDERGWYLV